MHPRILAQRSAIAQQRMLDAAERLANVLNLNEDVLTGLRVKSGDSDVRRMQEREAIANVLDALVAAVSVETPVELPSMSIETPEGEITIEAELTTNAKADDEPLVVVAAETKEKLIGKQSGKKGVGNARR